MKKTDTGLNHIPRRLFYTIGAMLAIFFVLALLVSFRYYSNAKFNIYRLPDHWTITYKGKVFHDVDLSQVHLPTSDCKRGDSIVMERQLDVMEDDPITLCLYTRHSQVNVMLDGKSCYMSGYQEMLEKRIVGSGYHFVLLPAINYGRQLKIVINAAQDGVLVEDPQVYVTPTGHAMEHFVRERALGLFIGVFIFVAGIGIMMVSIPAMLADKGFYPLSMIGIFSVFAGMWCLTSIKALEIFTMDLSRCSVIEYFSLYMLPIPMNELARYFYGRQRRFFDRLFLISSRVDMIGIIVISVLYLMRWVNISSGLVFFHGLLLWEVFFLLADTVVRWRKSDVAEKLFGGGIVSMCVTGAVYICLYHFGGRKFSSETIADTLFMPCAFLFMEVLVTIGFLMSVYAKRMSHAQHEKLLRMAYKDDLTGLYNRNKGEELLSSLREKEEPFALVNFDLNFLKRLNDNFGHEAGDAYIQTFADFLKSSFVGKSICRMGGDEFLVILTGKSSTREVAGKLLHDLIHKVRAYNLSPDRRFLMDAAIGIAGSDEVASGDPESVYRLADQRMYQMKVRTKRGRHGESEQEL